MSIGKRKTSFKDFMAKQGNIFGQALKDTKNLVHSAIVSGAFWDPDQKENLRTQINEWLEQGVIEPSVSPWVLPLVMVKKRDGKGRMRTDQVGHRSKRAE